MTSPGTHSIVRLNPGNGHITKRVIIPHVPQEMIAAYGSIWVSVSRY